MDFRLLTVLLAFCGISICASFTSTHSRPALIATYRVSKLGHKNQLVPTSFSLFMVDGESTTDDATEQEESAGVDSPTEKKDANGIMLVPLFLKLCAVLFFKFIRDFVVMPLVLLKMAAKKISKTLERFKGNGDKEGDGFVMLGAESS